MRARTLFLVLALAGLAAAPRVLSAQATPSPHDSTWLATHKEQAAGPTCAMCHQREFCASCHVNARNIAAIQAIPSSAQAAAQYRNRRWTYVEPATHRTDAWQTTHGPTARQNPNTCATCHSRESCTTCHRVEERLLPITVLPRATRGGARGVDLSGLRPATHTPTFARDHRLAAASNADASCRTCHTQSYCSTCHDGARTPTFHQTDYVERHAADAFTRETDCASCHQTQAFCTQCHRSVGVGAQGRLSATNFTQFHDKRSDWSVSHGRVARRSIETCTSCHRQEDCIQCHSPNGYARINPHPAGLDLSRMQSKNRATCLICHTTGAPTP